MKTITFDQINARVAAFHARENAPFARAGRALDALREALGEMGPSDRAEVVAMLAELVAEQDGKLPVYAFGWIMSDCGHEPTIERLQGALQAAAAWMEHVVAISDDRRIPSADALTDGRAILELSNETLPF